MTKRQLAVTGRSAALLLGLSVLSAGAAPPKPAPSKPAPQGEIKAAVPEFSLRLLGDRGLVDVKGKEGVARAAPGRYFVLGWKAALKDAQGREWTAIAATFGSAATSQMVGVTPGKAADVQIGPPLKASLTADAVGNRVNFRLHFFGPLGEPCNEVKVNGELPPKPWLTIRTAAGETVTRMEFDYGCSFFCSYIWRAPQELKGSYTVGVEFDFGPFKVEPVAPIAFELAGVDPNLVAARTGAEAPDFTLKAVEDGAPLQLRSLRPRPTLLCFFCACGLCASVAKALAEAPAPRPDLVALFNDPALCTPEAAKAFREKTGFRGALLADPGARVAAEYGSTACPRVWAIDGDGMIRSVNADPAMPAGDVAVGAVKALMR